MVTDNTKSLCPKCLMIIDAKIIKKDNKVYISKVCKTHGHFKALHPWGNLLHYETMKRLFNDRLPKARPDGLVININSRCNQNCPFCFAQANEYEIKEPSIGEIKEKISGFQGSTIYLSGGEPTLRRDILSIIQEIKKLDYKVYLFTNGKKLADIEFTHALKKSGIDLIILQFETFDEDQCVTLRGERLVATKLKAIENLKQVKIPLYLFAMLVKDVNIDQIEKLIRFTAQNSKFIKLLNFNPVWDLGRVAEHKTMNASDIFAEVEKNSTLTTEDFIEGAIFSCYIFEIYRKLVEKGGNKHPWCEMRCYMIQTKKGLITLRQLVDIKKFNFYLKKISGKLDKNINFKKSRFLFSLPYHFLIKELLFKKEFKRFVFKIISYFFNSIFKGEFPNFMHLEIFSIIIGTFHTAFNIDLSLVNTCNLYSDFPGGENRSSCLRQIFITEQFKTTKNTGFDTL